MVEQLAEFIANFDPWWMVAIAIVLILIDWTLLQTEAFMTVGLATLILAAINALEFSPMVQLWSYPICVFASFFLQRKFFILITKETSPYKSLETLGVRGLKEHIGKTGTLIVYANKDESSDYFYSYKDNRFKDSDIDPDYRLETNINAITKVLLADGSTHPSKLIGDAEIRNGQDVRVVGVDNGALLVKEQR